MTDDQWCGAVHWRTGRRCQLYVGHDGAHMSGFEEGSNGIDAWGGYGVETP